VPALRGTAESLPVAADRVDLLTVGEAFHWFEPTAALDEAHRVLRGGGTLALLWNRRDESVDWVARYGEIVVSERPQGRPYRTGVDWAEVVARHGGFGDHQRVHVDNPRACGPRQLVERAASTSFVADAEPGARERVLAQVRELTETHPELCGRTRFELPYVTELHTWTLS
jgi:SAM-dependent methyltransferase